VLGHQICEGYLPHNAEVATCCIMQKQPIEASNAGQDVEEALQRLPAEEVMGRNQRLKRASDVSLKRAYLPEELQKLQTPFLSYLQVPISSGLICCDPLGLSAVILAPLHAHESSLGASVRVRVRT
jgi:Ubiquinol-cytochrome C reductase complex 14kD subunit